MHIITITADDDQVHISTDQTNPADLAHALRRAVALVEANYPDTRPAPPAHHHPAPSHDPIGGRAPASSCICGRTRPCGGPHDCARM